MPDHSEESAADPHFLRIRWDYGALDVTVECPHEALGADRPCAVWANDDGSARQDACTFQQYADACFLEEWLHGPVEFPPTPIVAGGWGDEWHAKAAPLSGSKEDDRA